MATVNVYSPDDVIALGACKYWDVDIATSKNIGSRKWAGNQSHNMCKKDALKIDFWNIMCLLTSFIIGHFLALLSFPSNFYEWIYVLTCPSQFFCEPNFLASYVGYQCDVDIVGAIFTIICQCSCSHVNVCHSLFNV